MSKKKVGIITMYHNSRNYGGLLQAYALTRKISELGYDCEQISFDPYAYPYVKPVEESMSGWLRLKVLVYNLIYFVPKWIDKHNFKLLHSKLQLRDKAIENFRENKIPHSKVFNIESIEQCAKDYDIFVCGSDQIWNPNPYSTREAYYLDFVPSTKLKIAYAASFGVNRLSNIERDKISKYIKKIHRITVRESEGQNIIKDNFGLDSEVMLDPTLLMDSREWDELAEDIYIENPYMFVYLLGDSIHHRELIKKYAKMLNLKIVYLPHIHFNYEKTDIGFADIELYDVGPEGVVSLIKNANMVITDSFHGCVFSIIYEKKFWVLKRHTDNHERSMNSRLYSLFNLLGIKDRVIDEKENLELEYLVRDIDYKVCRDALLEYKEKSLNYLRSMGNISIEEITK